MAQAGASARRRLLQRRRRLRTSPARGGGTLTPTPTVAPAPTATPSPAMAFERPRQALQAEVTRLHERIVPRELTLRQRRFTGKIPKPKAVISIPGGPGGTAIVAGRSSAPMPGRGGATAFNIVRALTGQPTGRRTTISLQSSNVPATLRHETAHHILTAQGVPQRAQEPIISRARVPRTTSGVNFRLLQTAIDVHRTPTAEQRGRFKRQKQQLAFGALRRSSRQRQTGPARMLARVRR